MRLTPYMYGLARGDGLNNGTTQIYGSSYDGNVFLFEWMSAAAIVPNVLGLPQASAGTIITNAGLVVGLVTTVTSDTVSSGNIVSQQPASGTELAPGSAVNLTVSIGPPLTIRIGPADGQLLLTWPTSAVGFTLWFTTNLTMPNWTSVSPPPSVLNGTYVITNQAAGPAGFYQLRLE